MFKTFVSLSVPLLFFITAYAQNEDEEGCKDHPMFNRMPGFYINECSEKKFDAYSFTIDNSTESDAKTQTVEGKFYEITYYVNENGEEPSALEIFRNFENALKEINATIVAKVVEQNNSYSFITAKIAKNNCETWINVNAGGPDYKLVIVEKQLMEQVIKAQEMLKALNTQGFVSLNILFETGKSTIKKESQTLVDQLYELLNTSTGLNVSIEGHTDNTGSIESNKTLSVSRAEAVLNALVSKGINKARLSSKGWGQEKPVADNKTEEGRSKNRRVEIVKK
ncbi:MAG TPA: OmpA family protein [Chitinispirillaceae bacterium]|nr:OmpA family protein [Chitinispirillaceae bacterium]